MEEIEVSYINSTRRKWKLLKEFKVTLSNGITIEIPRAFVWDFSSVPQILWSIFPPFGDFLIAALVHDYLYHCNRLGIDLGFELTRDFADREMLYFSNKYNKNKADNYIRYIAVSVFGKGNWKEL